MEWNFTKKQSIYVFTSLKIDIIVFLNQNFVIHVKKVIELPFWGFVGYLIYYVIQGDIKNSSQSKIPLFL